jgi:hypothetical protein
MVIECRLRSASDDWETMFTPCCSDVHLLRNLSKQVIGVLVLLAAKLAMELEDVKQIQKFSSSACPVRRLRGKGPTTTTL